MKLNYEVRYAAHPDDAKSYDTTRLRKDFLISNLMVADEINLVYTMYDRLIVGGAVPVSETMELTAIDPLRAPFFLWRRELGIINVGGSGFVEVDGQTFELDYKEALYLGKGDRNAIRCIGTSNEAGGSTVSASRKQLGKSRPSRRGSTSQAYG